MKIVIDTNVILSALFSKNGASHLLLTWILNEYQQNNKVIVVSNTLITEYQAVLTRDENLTRINANKTDVLKFIDDINQFIVNALAEKISALKTSNYLTQKADQGSVNHMHDMLNQVADISPETIDKIK